MATLGTDIARIFNTKIFKAYSNFYNSLKLNDLMKESLFTCIEQKYKTMADQRDYDALSSVLHINSVFAINNNTIHTAPIDITNITRVGSNFIITTAIPHNIIVGDFVTMANIQGFVTTPTLNGGFIVTNFSVSSNQFSVTATYTSGAYVAGTGQVVAHSIGGEPKMINDYLHLLAVKTRFYHPIITRHKILNITNVSNTQPIVVTVDNKNNNLRTTEKLSLSGIVGNTNANGTFYIKKINNTQIELYTDKQLVVPQSGNGTYGGIGAMSRVQYNYASRLFSNEKVSDYDTSTLSDPRYEQGGSTLTFIPDAFVCDEITVDYITNNITLIDVTNTIFDYESLFPFEFITHIIDTAVTLFTIQVKDSPSIQPNLLLEQKTN